MPIALIEQLPPPLTLASDLPQIPARAMAVHVGFLGAHAKISMVEARTVAEKALLSPLTDDDLAKISVARRRLEVAADTLELVTRRVATALTPATERDAVIDGLRADLAMLIDAGDELAEAATGHLNTRSSRHTAAANWREVKGRVRDDVLMSGGVA